LSLQGVMIDGLYSVETAIAHYSLPPAASKKGSVTASYSARETIQAKIEQKPPKAGVAIGFYDPVLSALLSGEF